MEPQPGTTAPGTTNYDFILNPDQQKKGAGFGFIKDPFIAKIIFLVGGAVVLMVAIGLIVSFAFGGKTNTETFVALTQREEEIVRVSALGDDAVSQRIKNAAISTQVSIRSQQNELLAYLKTHGRSVAPDELVLTKNASTDNKLKLAKQTSTFDTTYTDVMREQLTAYANELKTAYDNESGSTQRQLLSAQYKDVQLLLKTWPEASATQ